MRGAKPATKVLMLLAFVVASLALAGNAQAAADDAPGKLFIKAQGELLTQYDMTEVTLRINAEDRSNTSDSASLAQSKHAETSQNLISFIEGELGIPLANMTTTAMSIDPIYNYSDSYAGAIGYSVYNSIDISTAASNLDALPKLYEAVGAFGSSENGVTVSVSGFDPYVSDELRNALEETLFEQAMAKASRKAQMYAKGAGRALGPIMVMSDTPIEATGSSPPPAYFDKQQESLSLRAGNSNFFAEAPPALDGTQSNGFLLGEGEKLSYTVYLEYKLQ